MTQEQLDNWFGYHPPTEETAPKYAAIREAEQQCARELVDALGGLALNQAPFARINAATRCFAEAIDANAPDSADKSAAIRCVRLARNAANEAVVVFGEAARGSTASETRFPFLLQVLAEQLLLARWQACAAVACGGR